MNSNGRRVRAAAAALAATGVFLSGAPASAQSSGTIQACYDKRNGQLRIAAPNQCAAIESSEVLNLRSPAALPG
jgi:hypothetical protein